MIRRGLTALGLLAFGVASGVAGQHVLALWPNSTPAELTAVGIIRPDGAGGWHILDDADHGPINLESVTVEDDQIVVHFSQPFGRLLAFHVGADDDLTRDRVMVGASTGLAKIGIVLTDRSGPVAPASVTNTLANIQIFVLGLEPVPHEADGD